VYVVRTLLLFSLHTLAVWANEHRNTSVLRCGAAPRRCTAVLHCGTVIHSIVLRSSRSALPRGAVPPPPCTVAPHRGDVPRCRVAAKCRGPVPRHVGRGTYTEECLTPPHPSTAALRHGATSRHSASALHLGAPLRRCPSALHHLQRAVIAEGGGLFTGRFRAKNWKFWGPSSGPGTRPVVSGSFCCACWWCSQPRSSILDLCRSTFSCPGFCCVRNPDSDAVDSPL
jgi:hypothetical protein